MAITQSDFNNWKQDEVTQQIRKAMNDRIMDTIHELTGDARNDLDLVNWYRGYIRAYEEMLDVDFFEVTSND